MNAPMTDLQEIAHSAGRELEDAPATEVLAWAADTFGGQLCVASSMGDAVVIHMAAQAHPGIDVLFLDTGYHFTETLGTRDAVAAAYQVNVINVVPGQTVAEQDATYGARLHDRMPDRCCDLRKVAPLDRALGDYQAWASGIRRDESRFRQGVPLVAWDARRGKVKINPLARWTGEDVEAYIAEHDVIVNPLRHDGYPSIGCAPCTQRVEIDADPRSGRWAGVAKTECGIHN